MANLPLKILLLTKYNQRGASSRLRTLQYIPYLKFHGVSVTASNFFDDAYLREFHLNSKRSIIRVLKSYIKRLFVFLTFFKYDLIWIEKEIFPYFPAFFERFLNFVGKTYVVDYDDYCSLDFLDLRDLLQQVACLCVCVEFGNMASRYLFFTICRINRHISEIGVVPEIIIYRMCS